MGKTIDFRSHKWMKDAEKAISDIEFMMWQSFDLPEEEQLKLLNEMNEVLKPLVLELEKIK